MNSSSGTVFELPCLKNSCKSKELEKNRLMPPRDKYYVNKMEKESDWQQEYYIIYNSYVLDKK